MHCVITILELQPEELQGHFYLKGLGLRVIYEWIWYCPKYSQSPGAQMLPITFEDTNNHEGGDCAVRPGDWVCLRHVVLIIYEVRKIYKNLPTILTGVASSAATIVKFIHKGIPMCNWDYGKRRRHDGGPLLAAAFASLPLVAYLILTGVDIFIRRTISSFPS